MTTIMNTWLSYYLHHHRFVVVGSFVGCWELGSSKCVFAFAISTVIMQTLSQKDLHHFLSSIIRTKVEILIILFFLSEDNTRNAK